AAGAPPSSSQRSSALATLSRGVGGVDSPSLVSPLVRSPDRLGVFVISKVAKWPSAFPRTCLRRPSGSRGTFPTACYRDLQHFVVDLFRSGDPPKKECLSLFI